MDMLLKYGSYKTALKRLKNWQEEGIWNRIFKALASIRSHNRAVIDSSTIEAKNGRINRMRDLSIKKAQKYMQL
jgi:hypothetical protein